MPTLGRVAIILLVLLGDAAAADRDRDSCAQFFASKFRAESLYPGKCDFRHRHSCRQRIL